MSKREAPKRKTDNRSLRNKIALRQWLLGEMGITDCRVLDTCAGAGQIWDAMREHVTLSTWIRSDIKPRRAGTLKLSAVQMIGVMPIADFNVIDIDPYGEPWAAYLALLPRLTHETAVFLTRGTVSYGVLTDAVLETFGIPRTWPVPHSQRLAAYLDSLALSETWRYADVLHASTLDLKDVSYFALGLRPHRGARGELAAASSAAPAPAAPSLFAGAITPL
jgi:hypothetical protein